MINLHKYTDCFEFLLVVHVQDTLRVTSHIIFSCCLIFGDFTKTITPKIAENFSHAIIKLPLQ